MFQMPWVGIPALYTGWTFFHIRICCKICNVFERTKIREKDAGVGPFLKRLATNQMSSRNVAAEMSLRRIITVLSCKPFFNKLFFVSPQKKEKWNELHFAQTVALDGGWHAHSKDHSSSSVKELLGSALKVLMFSSYIEKFGWTAIRANKPIIM